MRFSNYLRTQSFPEDDGGGNKLPEEPGLSGSPGMRTPPQSLTPLLRKQRQCYQNHTASGSGLHLVSEEPGGATGHGPSSDPSRRHSCTNLASPWTSARV